MAAPDAVPAQGAAFLVPILHTTLFLKKQIDNLGMKVYIIDNGIRSFKFHKEVSLYEETRFPAAGPGHAAEHLRDG
nr:hypothetical protein [Clostridia bacterium]